MIIMIIVSKILIMLMAITGNLMMSLVVKKIIAMTIISTSIKQ